MARVNDVLNAAAKPEKELGRLLLAEYRGEAKPTDGEAIRDCWRSLREGGLDVIEGSGWTAPNTQADRLSQLRLTAVRMDKPLLDFEAPRDVRAAITAHEQAGAESTSAKRGYAAALRTFFYFLDSEPDRGDFAWIEHYNPPSRENTDERKVDPGDFPGEPDIDAIRRALQYRRDKTLIELVVDCGLRRTAACQLRVGDVDLDTTPPAIQLNPEGLSQKGAHLHDIQRIDLKDSEIHVRSWLREDHPEAPDPPDDAPLFPVEEGYEPENREDGAVHPESVQNQIDDAAEKAGVTDVKVNLHGFKHAAVKRFRWRYEMSWEAIRDRVLWSDNSLGDMMKIYGRLDNEERRERIRQEMDNEAEPAEEGQPSTATCGTCGREIPPTANFCPGCGKDPDAAPGEAGRSVTKKDVARMMIRARQLDEEGVLVDADADDPDAAVDAVVDLVESEGHQGSVAKEAFADE